MIAEYTEQGIEAHLKGGEILPGEARTTWRFSRAVVENLKGDGVWVRKTDNVHLLDGQSDRSLIITMSICPLYEMGNLGDSHLMASPARLEHSRVAEKWRAGIKAIEAVKKTCTQRGQDVSVVLTLADLGVISRDPEREDPSVLDYHNEVYQEAAGRDLKERLGVSVETRRYSDLVPSHPRFIPATEHVLFLSQDQVSYEAEQLIQELARSGIQFDPALIDVDTGVINKRARRIVEGLMRLKGNPSENGYSIELARGLMSQYGAFDAKTSRPDGLNLFIERESAGLLLQVTDLFAHSRAPRVDILV